MSLKASFGQRRFIDGLLRSYSGPWLDGDLKRTFDYEPFIKEFVRHCQKEGQLTSLLNREGRWARVRWCLNSSCSFIPRVGVTSVSWFYSRCSICIYLFW